MIDRLLTIIVVLLLAHFFGALNAFYIVLGIMAVSGLIVALFDKNMETSK